MKRLIGLGASLVVLIVAIGCAVAVTHRFDEQGWPKPLDRYFGHVRPLTAVEYAKMSDRALAHKALSLLEGQIDFIGKNEIVPASPGGEPANAALILAFRPYSSGWPGMCRSDGLSIDLVAHSDTTQSESFEPKEVHQLSLYGILGDPTADVGASDQAVWDKKCSASAREGRGFYFANDAAEAWYAANVLTAVTRLGPTDHLESFVCRKDGIACKDGYASLHRISALDLESVTKNKCQPPINCLVFAVPSPELPKGSRWRLNVKAAFSRKTANGYGIPVIQRLSMETSSKPPLTE